MFKFIHAADIHLDSPLRGLERYEGAPVDEVRQASRRALERLVDLAVQEEVAFVLLCGDVFDGDWKDYKTGLFFARQMGRLGRAGVRAFWIRGNHDSQNSFAKKRNAFDNLTMFSSNAAETTVLDECEVALHGRSFPSRHVDEDLTEGYPDPIPGLFNIGLLHTSLDGRPGHDVYAPCSVEGLVSKGYQYWALGHVHEREVVRGEDPWIVFPGCIQGRHARETGPKGCTLVTVEDGEVVEAAHRELCVMRWEGLDCDATGVVSAVDVVNLVREGVQSLVEDAGDASLAVRVEVQGACKAHAELVAARERWTNEIRAQVMSACGEEAWIEKVRFNTGMEQSLDAAMDRDDALGGLLRSIRDLDLDESRIADLATVLDDLKNKLPPDLTQGFDPLRIDEPAYLRAELAEARDLLIARLVSGGGDQ